MTLASDELDQAGGLTRRGVITGAVAAGAAGTIGAVARGGSARAVARGPKPPFDVRDQIDGSALDGECIQCVYDDINRMVMLIGDIPFRDLFHTPMSRLVPLVGPRVQTAAQFNLIDNPGQVLADLAALVQGAGGSTVADFYIKADTHVPNEIRAILIDLRHHGVRITLPNVTHQDSAVRKDVIHRLDRAAGGLTFKGLHTLPKRHASRALLNAVKFAKTNQLLGWWTNDRCCEHGAEKFVKLDLCRPSPDLYCAYGPGTQTKIRGVTYGICTIASDDCPAKPESSGSRGR